MKHVRNSSRRSTGVDVPKAKGWSGRPKPSAKLPTPDSSSRLRPDGSTLPRDIPPVREGEYLERDAVRVKAEPERETGEQLRAAVRHYKELYDLVPVSFVTLDKRGVILALNERAARLLAFPVQWLLERSFLVFVSTRDVERFLSLLSHLRRVRD